ncbi:MAG TPA: hypothetical protein EYP22_06155 [Methanosarcinales archaeon]|nr:hypothetical protein [Methanosarcinales archaeon]
MNEIQIEILEKLIRNKYIGGKHTSEDNVCKGFPKHEIKKVRKELKKLIKQGYVISKPTSYGLEMSINPKMLKEIKKRL